MLAQVLSLWHAVLALPRQRLPGLRVASFLPLAVRVPQVFGVGLLLGLLVDLPLLLPRGISVSFVDSGSVLPRRVLFSLRKAGRLCGRQLLFVLPLFAFVLYLFQKLVARRLLR